ncbi:MAG TPA: cupin domain-containing protein [Phenylobacterium sp.]|nr:cupin domain-containing protein [Phenylobacterium sp.]
MTERIIRTAGFDWSQALRGRHPLNEASEMQLVRLGDISGMRRVFTNLVRIPPGKESWIPHAHSVEEEMAFVLEGTGDVVLDGERQAIGPGDYVGFPVDGVVHSIVNTGTGPLTYLTVGERSRVEVADMPTLGKTAVFRPGGVDLYGPDGLEHLTEAEWGARMQLPSAAEDGKG